MYRGWLRVTFESLNLSRGQAKVKLNLRGSPPPPTCQEHIRTKVQILVWLKQGPTLLALQKHVQVSHSASHDRSSQGTPPTCLWAAAARGERYSPIQNIRKDWGEEGVLLASCSLKKKLQDGRDKEKEREAIFRDNLFLLWAAVKNVWTKGVRNQQWGRKKAREQGEREIYDNSQQSRSQSITCTWRLACTCWI